MNKRYRRVRGHPAMLVTLSGIACNRSSKTCQVFSPFEPYSFWNAGRCYQSLRRLSRRIEGRFDLDEECECR
jgi:hypothetical protein